MKKSTKKLKTGKNLIKEKAIYGLYDPSVKKYVKSINFQGWRYGSVKIYYSTNTKALLLSDNDLAKHYSKTFEIKSRLKLAEKELIDFARNQQVSKTGLSKEKLKEEISDLKKALKIINRFKLYQFKIVSDRNQENLLDFKTKSISKLMKKLIRNSFISRYGWAVAEWFLREIKKPEVKFPYALIAFDINTYNLNAKSNQQEEILKKIKGLGIKANWFSRYQNQMEIAKEEDYHLICLGFDSKEIYQKILISDLLAHYQEIQEDIKNYISNKW